MYGALEAGLFEIANGLDTARTAKDMVAAWGNPWAGCSALVEASVVLSRGSDGDILEFGSGLTSLAMAAANPHIKINCMEHDPEWAKITKSCADKYNLHNINVEISSLKGGFYDDVPSGNYGLVVCDGPPRLLGSRAGAYSYGAEAPVFLMDDLDCVVASKHFKEWSQGLDRQYSIAGRVGISKKAA
jgi:hypothetical protein